MSSRLNHRERMMSDAPARLHGQPEEIAHAVTSPSPEQADPDAMLALWHDRRVIENRMHRRPDVVLREDGSPVRSGTSPCAPAALRITLLDVVHEAAEPLCEIFAEDRLGAIAVARGIPRVALTNPARGLAVTVTCRYTLLTERRRRLGRVGV